jgi:hypothetical protein
MRTLKAKAMRMLNRRAMRMLNRRAMRMLTARARNEGTMVAVRSDQRSSLAVSGPLTGGSK